MKPEDKPYVELGTTFSKGAIGAPVTDTQVEILRLLFDPDEAHLAASVDYLPEPEEVIAKRAGVSLEDAAELLTRMASRDLIRGVKRPDGVRVFRIPLFAPGLFEIVYVNRAPSPDLDKLGALFEKYFHEGWGHETHGNGVPVSRVLPAVGPPKDHVVPYEDALKLLEGTPFAALVNCQCRRAVRACDHPTDVCIGLGLVIPLILGAYTVLYSRSVSVRFEVNMIWLTSGLILVGGFIFRLAVVLGGQLA